MLVGDMRMAIVCLVLELSLCVFCISDKPITSLRQTKCFIHIWVLLLSPSANRMTSIEDSCQMFFQWPEIHSSYPRVTTVMISLEHPKIHHAILKNKGIAM